MGCYYSVARQLLGALAHLSPSLLQLQTHLLLHFHRFPKEKLPSSRFRPSLDPFSTQHPFSLAIPFHKYLYHSLTLSSILPILGFISVEILIWVVPMNFVFFWGPGRVLVVSYNILGDDNASNHRDLYAHIPPHFMKWERRKSLICQQLREWSADIICLQARLQDNILQFHN